MASVIDTELEWVMRIKKHWFDAMPLPYGVSCSVIQQTRVLRVEASRSWTIAPGVPFHPFPPLPLRSALSSEHTVKAEQCSESCTIDPPEKNITVANGRPDFEQGSCYSLGREYFREQKSNHSKQAPPWVRTRNSWGYSGNSSFTLKEVHFIGDSQKAVKNILEAPFFSTTILYCKVLNIAIQLYHVLLYLKKFTRQLRKVISIIKSCPKIIHLHCKNKINRRTIYQGFFRPIDDASSTSFLSMCIKQSSNREIQSLCTLAQHSVTNLQ